MIDSTSPDAGENEAAKAEAAYGVWLRSKLAMSISDTRPSVAHSEVERRMDQRIRRLKASRVGSSKPGGP